jgi:hypothetical protein
VQHADALKTRDTCRNYSRAQLEGWLGIVRPSPAAWHWLAWTTSFPGSARLSKAEAIAPV